MENQQEVEEIIEEPEVQPEPEISPDVIQRAKMMGHKPKEEFLGDPEKWVPADKYVERADTLMPILKSQLGKYENKILGLEAEIEGQKKKTEKMLKMNEKAQEIAYERAKKDLIKQQAQAVADSNIETWQRLEDEKDQLKKPEPIVVEPVQNTVYQNWVAENDWIKNDTDMSIYANSVGPLIQEQNPNISYSELLNMVEKKVKEVFPHKFENPKRQEAPTVDSGRPVVTKKGGKTYNDLDQDAKAMCDQNIAQGLYKTKSDWVKAYFEEE